MKKVYFSPTTHQDAVINNGLLMVSSNVPLKYNKEGGIPLKAV